MQACPHCRANIPSDVPACPFCQRQLGHLSTLSPQVMPPPPPPPPLSVGSKHCFACASVIDMRAEICPRCGVRQPGMAPVVVMAAAPVPHTTKSKGAAAALAFFLGGIGIHKFYLGQTGAGVVYLLFCWTFIPALIAFIEFLILLGMSEAEFARKFPG